MNEVPISEYGSDYVNKYFQFHVTADKRDGWLRSVGQELPVVAYLTPDPLNNEYREYRMFGNGAQTFKRTQDTLDMYIPCLFWCNLDVRQAFPNVKMPKGSVKVRFKFAALDMMVAGADYGGGGAYTRPAIATADLYVNHISTIPEVENVFMQDYIFTLMRTVRTTNQIVNHPQDSISISKELRLAVEHMAFAFRPIANEADVDNWYRGVVLQPVNITVPVAVYDTTQTLVSAANTATYYSEGDVVDTLGFQIDGVDIFQSDTTAKYSSYFTLAARGLVTPSDRGWLLMNMQLYPAEYEPSGHINFGTNRKLYLNYTSSYITGSTPARLIGIYSTINFLIVHNNSVNLRYL